MIGISASNKEEINKIVEDMFDNIALQFIGEIPSLKNKKTLIISSKKNYGLPHLFVKAMNAKPNKTEQEALKSMLMSAHGYIESLKARTKSNIIESIDSIVKESKIKKNKVNEFDIKDVISNEMSKAKSQLRAIVESESTKLRNVGSLMSISRVAAARNEDDPSVFFVVTKDGVTCKECLRLHLLPDGTPRVWKLSELKQGYHKRGEDNPSAFGLHPHCRCLYDGNSPVITEKGVKSLKNITTEDRVLTHTGKFKEVLATFGQKGQPANEDLYRIEFISPDGKIRKLRTTTDHLMLTDNGWKRVDELIPEIDSLKYLFKECEFCKCPFPHNIQKPNKRFCSKKCSSTNSMGWHVLRYSEKTGMKTVLEDVRRVSLNSTSGYSFKNVKIKNIKKVRKCFVSKRARLYDITVKDDESFVIMGVVSHNCTLTYLTKGFGFKNGMIAYIGEDHDEFAKQRKFVKIE